MRADWLVDAGKSLDDAGVDDAGVDDAGPALDPPWLDAAFAFRQRVALLPTNDVDIPAGYPVRVRFDHAALVAAGAARASGDDLHVVYWDGVAWQELPRALARRSGWSREDTTLVLETARAIASGASDDGYFLYFGVEAQSDAPLPLTEGPPEARVVVEESLAAISSDTRTHAEVATLTFRPGDVDEQWIVVGTWQQRGVTVTQVQEHGDARIRVNGQLRLGTSGISFHQTEGHYKSTGVVIPITGVAGPQHVTLEFAAFWDGYVDEIRNVRLMAFLVPGANAQVAESLAEVPVTTAAQPITVHSLEVQASAEYLWLVSAFGKEGASAINRSLWILDESGAVRQEQRETVMNEHGSLHLMHFERRALAAGDALTLVHETPDNTTGLPAIVHGITQVLVPTGGFTVVSASHDPEASTTSSTRSTLVTLEVPAPGLDHEQVYFAVSTVDHDPGSVGPRSVVDVTFDGVAVQEDTFVVSGRRYPTQVVWTSAEEVAAPRTIEIGYRQLSGGQTTRVSHAHLIALRYHEVTTSEGPIEARP